MKLIVVVFCCLAAFTSSSYAEMYKCTEEGRTIFQERPCQGKGGAITVRPATGDAPPQSATTANAASGSSSSSAAKTAETATMLQRDRQMRELGYQIDDTEREISKLEAGMDAELATLRNKKSLARNNLAGATYEQSISTEMQSITEKYKTKISTVQMKLESLKKDRESLRSKQ